MSSEIDTFIHIFQDDIYIKQALALKEVKHAIHKLVTEDSMESLYVIDIIQRFGIEHHFEDEIEAVLQKQCSIFSSHLSDLANDHNLYELALLFRLLRQRAHHVSAGSNYLHSVHINYFVIIFILLFKYLVTNTT